MMDGLGNTFFPDQLKLNIKEVLASEHLFQQIMYREQPPVTQRPTLLTVIQNVSTE